MCSLIPIQGENGGTAFVKDPKGEVVKSKLDENRLREIAQSAGSFLHLDNGPRTMQQLVTDGLVKMQVADINARLSRRPIERYEWPLAVAIFLFALALLINDRKTKRARAASPGQIRALAATTAALLMVSARWAHGAAPGIDLYKQQKFPEAYAEFRKTLEENHGARQTDRIQFDAGAAAYKMKDYSKALEAFSQALLSKNPHLQSESHYNLGNALFQRGDAEKIDAKKLTKREGALKHYQERSRLNRTNKNAKDNYDYVKNKIEELKKKQQEQQQNQKQNQQDQQQQREQQKQQNQQQQKNQQNQQQQQQQQQDQNSSGAPPSPTPPIEPSEDAKKAKAEADKAVLARHYGNALKIMTDQLRNDPTVNHYSDYIRRLEEINGIKKTDTP